VAFLRTRLSCSCSQDEHFRLIGHSTDREQTLASGEANMAMSMALSLLRFAIRAGNVGSPFRVDPSIRPELLPS
jgi:hypothetical protein